MVELYPNPLFCQLDKINLPKEVKLVIVNLSKYQLLKVL